jgi:hypothetical protein
MNDISFAMTDSVSCQYTLIPAPVHPAHISLGIELHTWQNYRRKRTPKKG